MTAGGGRSLSQAWAGLWNVAGGLPYHVQAWRFRRRLWGPYRAQVAAVLAEWAPPQTELVIVGPSAGWNLPPAFLARFAAVTAVEPDPLATWLLRRRFPGVHWQIDSDDYFTPAGPRPWRENLDRLFARYPTEALLFSGFLGQLVGLYPDAVATEGPSGACETAAFGRWKAHLRAHLLSRSYCTLHDRWVSAAPPLLPGPLALTAAGTVDADGPPPLALWAQQEPAVDPFTAGLTPQAPQRLLVWQRLPRRWHVMAAVWQNTGAVAGPEAGTGE